MRAFKSLLTIFFLFVLNCSYSQSSFQVQAGLSNPLSDFGSQDLDNEKAGLAGPGLSIGLAYRYQINESGLGLFGGFDFFSNGITSGAKIDLEEFFESLGVFGADYTFERYSNTPFSAGLDYQYAANANLKVCLSGGLVVNILNISDFKIEQGGASITTEYFTSSSLGFRLGGSLLIHDKVNIAIDYYGLGNHNVEGRTRSTGVPSEDFNIELPLTILAIRAGFVF